MTQPTEMPLRIGTRASALARWQAGWVGQRLEGLGFAVQLAPISTAGDVETQRPIGSIGTVGVFTKELQRALLDRRIDLAVHSLKDLPTEPAPGLVLAAVPARETVRDVLLSHGGEKWDALPAAARIGTGSLRRRAALLHHRPDLSMRDVRGNVETRIAKLDRGDFDALVLAEAGLIRLGLADRITDILPPAVILPAVGQGALGIETREDDESTRAAVAALDDWATRAAVLAERALLTELAGGCLAPIGAWARLVPGGVLRLEAAVYSGDGRRKLTVDLAGEVSAATEIGRRAAHELLQQGAGALIATARAGGN